MRPNRDAYGCEIDGAIRGEGFLEVIERDDGLVEGSAENAYFAEFKNWPEHQKKVIASGALLIESLEGSRWRSA